jgi:hypothetical protein
MVVGLLLLSPPMKDWAPWVLGGGLLAIAGLAVWVGKTWANDRRRVAQLIEQRFPQLDSRLITALELRPLPGQLGLSFLQHELLAETSQIGLSQPWEDAIPTSKLWTARLLQIASFLVCGVLLGQIVLGRFDSPTENLLAEAPVPAHGQQPTELPAIAVTVEPGDVEIEAGRTLLVTARFPGELPAGAELVVLNDAGELARLPMRRSLKDPVFGGSIPDVQQTLTYRVEYAEGQSADYRVAPYTLPQLVRADAELQYPEYTGLETKRLEDIRRVTVVEGTKLAWDCVLNKEVQSAVLVGDDGTEIELTMRSRPPGEGLENAVVMQGQWTAGEAERHRFRLQLRDAAGRMNRDPETLIVEVVPNRPPELKVAFPGRDVRTSPIEELQLAATAADDFGIRELGVVYQLPGGDEQSLTVEIDAQQAPARKAEFSNLLQLEQWSLQPNDLISYAFYADDIGPDGAVRRTFSDLFFAEVRDFEEIFRQVASSAAEQRQQQQAGEQQGEQSPSEELLESQKQIIVATWNLQRRERGSRPSPQFEGDLVVLRDSQAKVQELTEARLEELQDAELRQYAEAAAVAMQQAAAEFERVRSLRQASELQHPLQHAQTAYRELLKLNSREKQVQNSQQQSSSSQSRSSAQRQMQQQLNQLELNNDRSRYQNERQAQEQQQRDQAAQETLQVLNRLRELARRQEELNQKVKELEQQLRNAASAEEQRELQRQLKRLQDEQQQMLRDVDELREQMDQPQNQEQMADAREQVDQTRERVLRASQALEQGQTSQALTEGTRAERELNELKEQFRQQSAGQFDDRVRELRQNVDELASNQREIQRQMRANPAAADPAAPRTAPSLREEPKDDRRAQLAENLQGQKTRLEETLEQMKSLIEDSEQTESLLSSRLYDTVRDLRKFEPEDALELASRLFRNGYDQEAQAAEEQARQGIERLQDGVRQAARSVLGDETAALRLAQSELQELTESIARELAQSDAARNPADHQATPSGGRTPGNSGEQTQPTGDDPAAEQSPPGSRGDRETPSEQRERATRSPGTNPEEQPQSPRDGAGMERPGDAARPPGRPAEQENAEAATPAGENDPAGEPGSGGRRPGSPDASKSERRPGEQNSNSAGPNEPGREENQPGMEQRGAAPTGEQASPQQPNGQQGGSPGESESSGDAQRGGQQSGRGEQTPSGQAAAGGGSPPRSGSDSAMRSVLDALGGGGGRETDGGFRGPERPLTGTEFRQWSDRMRSLEEMLTDPDLQARAAEIRDQARQMRNEVQRHSQEPNWDLVRTGIYGPMLELQRRIAEDLARRERTGELVPIDRDPVPEQYRELVKQYYEELSRMPLKP